jgi:hypothetical protein
MSPISRAGAVPTRTVVVHDRVEPPLTAGDYEVRVSQTVGGDPDLGTVPDDVRHLRVTGPRYRLPGTEVLSVFPPPDGDGPFSTRLAQVALKRRTLPWERADGPQRPWLALVLLTDGEGTYLPSVPVEQAVTQGVRLTGPNPDGATCAAIEVPGRVVRQVFPSRQDLPFTTHVRQVPLDDTELAQGDDDGWVAVVFGTRLPRPGMRYRACLISLEGQWTELPDEPPTSPGIDKFHVYDTLDAAVLASARRPRSDGVALNLAGAGAHAVPRGPAPRMRPEGVDREEIPHRVPPASTGHAAPDAWTAAATGRPAAAEPAAPVVPAATAAGGRSVILDVTFTVYDPGARLLRFPVLASWEFRCEGGKDFATLVQELDVGLLGTAARPGRGPTDRVPEVAETGHLVLAGSDRSGEPTSSWYRGPFVPHAVVRRAPEAVHVADQLRRVAEDGRAELGEAAAFELGRLLALSQPSTVAALRDWRRRGFTARRAGTVGEVSVLGGILAHWNLVTDGVLTVDRLATALGQTLLTTVGDAGTVDALLPARPRVAPLPKVDILADVAATVATGLEVPLRDLRRALAGGTRPPVTAELLSPLTQVGFDKLAADPALLAPLSAGLSQRVGQLGSVIRATGPGPGIRMLPADTVEDLFPRAVPGAARLPEEEEQ